MFKKFLCVLSVAIVCSMGFVHVSAEAEPATPEQVSAFLANPASLLASNPDGGANLVSTIRDLLLADPSTLQVVISLLANANEAQQAALGSGLGQAAQASMTTNPTFANQIQEALAASGVQTAIAAYSATTGNTVTAATGGGGGGGLGGPTNSFGGFPGGGGSGGGAGGSQAGGGSNTDTSGKDINPSNNALVDPNAASTSEEQSKGNISPINP